VHEDRERRPSQASRHRAVTDKVSLLERFARGLAFGFGLGIGVCLGLGVALLVLELR
jgi:hypothetical protein